MGPLLATTYRAPASLLDSLLDAAARLLGGKQAFRRWPVATDASFGQLAGAGVRDGSLMVAATAPPTASADRLSTVVDGQYERFQREIVPHLDAAYNFARFSQPQPDAAQDIVQESFLRAYRRFDRYKGGDPAPGSFPSCATAITTGCWTAAGRLAWRLTFIAATTAADFSIDDVASDDDTPEAALMRQSEAGKVRHVLNLLPRTLREVLVLRELEGLSYREIAEAAGLPIGTVMSRLARARTQFETVWCEQATATEATK